MDSKHLLTILNNIPREELVEMVYDWMLEHHDFQDYLLGSYLAKSEDGKNEIVDFKRLINNALCMCQPETKPGGRWTEYDDYMLHWNEVYDNVIQPYEAKVDEMQTSQLVNFVEAILTVIIPDLSEEDYYGDDWYGTDYSSDIQCIICASESGMMEIVTREDFSKDMGDVLMAALEKASENRKIDVYADMRWDDFVKLIKQRMEDEGLTSAMFDRLADLTCSGQWVIRKIQFLESVGNYPEAEEILRNNLGIEDVKDFKYNRLVSSEQWDEAFKYLDLWEKEEKNGGWHLEGKCKWRKKKLELATRLGKRDLQIRLLGDLFVDDYSRRKHYDTLKKLVDPADWEKLYPQLLKRAEQNVCTIGEFLVEEGETDWLYRLICKENEETPLSYHQMIEYYPHLASKYGSDMRCRIKEALLCNARTRFAPGMKCKSEWYSSFCDALRDFRSLGASEEAAALIATFLSEFCARRNFIQELKTL